MLIKICKYIIMTFIRTQDWYSCQEKPKRDKLQLRCADVLKHCLDVVRGESR